MSPPSPYSRDLARRLMTASRSAADPQVNDAAAVSERLRVSLTRFAGADGFESLQRRAWTLASAEVPALRRVQVGKGGRLEGLEALAADSRSAAGPANAGNADEEPAVAITAHLLELMSTFIGNRLTLKLIHEAWPDTSLDEWQSTTEADQ